MSLILQNRDTHLLQVFLWSLEGTSNSIQLPLIILRSALNLP